MPQTRAKQRKPRCYYRQEQVAEPLLHRVEIKDESDQGRSSEECANPFKRKYTEEESPTRAAGYPALANTWGPGSNGTKSSASPEMLV